MDNKEGQAVAVQVFSKCRNEGTKYLIMFAKPLKYRCAPIVRQLDCL